VLTRIATDQAAEQVHDLFLEEVVEVHEEELVDLVLEAPVALGERLDRQDLVEEGARALQPEKAVQARLVLGPQVQALPHWQAQIAAAVVRRVADLPIYVIAAVELVAADIRRADDLRGPVERR